MSFLRHWKRHAAVGVATLTLVTLASLAGDWGVAFGQTAPQFVGVCHHTGSATNPYVFLRLPQPAATAHLREHEGDFIAESPEACPAP